MIHKLELNSYTLHGSFSKEYQPILTVNSGDTIHLNTADIQWGYSSSKGEERRIFESRVKEEKPGHPLLVRLLSNRLSQVQC